jgi:hypothetical protein
VPDEAGGAEPGDGGGWEIEGVKRDSVRSFNFHAVSMAGQGGHPLSKAKIIAPKKNQRLGGVSRTGCDSRAGSF